MLTSLLLQAQDSSRTVFFSSLSNVGGIIAIIGGVVGILGGCFAIINGIKKHVKEPNLILFDKCIKYSYNECFNNTSVPPLINNHDFDKIHGLVHNIITFKKNGNSFKGFRANSGFKSVHACAMKIDSQFDQFTPVIFIHGSTSESALMKYKEVENEVKELDKEYKRFFRLIKGFIPINSY